MAHLWNLIVESNTLNFIVLAIILLFAFKKINLPEMISKLQQNIENAVNESNLAKTKSQEALKIAEEKMKNVDKEVENIIEDTQKTAQIVSKNIIIKLFPFIPPKAAHRYINKEKTSAKNTFEAGPASATSIWCVGLGMFLKSIMTGFAQPKPTVKSKIVPRGSRCFKGFRVNLPIIFAVGSPNLYATQPCASS